MKSSPEELMQLAVKQADSAAARGDLPIGAVIIDLDSDEIIVQTGNKQSSFFDPTAHAEITAIREACQKEKSTYLPHHAIIVTTEPCTMCISAILKAQIPQVYFGVSIQKLLENGFDLLPISSEEIVQKSGFKTVVQGKILEEDCLAQRLKYKKAS